MRGLFYFIVGVLIADVFKVVNIVPGRARSIRIDEIMAIENGSLYAREHAHNDEK